MFDIKGMPFGCGLLHWAFCIILGHFSKSSRAFFWVCILKQYNGTSLPVSPTQFMFQTKCDCPWSPGVTPCSAEPTGQWLLRWPVQPPGPLFCLIQALLSTCWSSAACSCISLLFTLSFTILTFQIFYPSVSLPGYLSPPGFCPRGCVPPLCWCRGNCRIAEVCSSQKKTGGLPARPQVLSRGRIGGGWEREEGSR